MKNIYNINSNYNFLESLVRFILDKYNYDVSQLADIVIFLPSKRSCRLIKKIFFKQSQQKAIILPDIRAIGDVDYDEIGLNFLNNEKYQDYVDLISQPISKLKYRALLISEIKDFNQKTQLFGKNITINQINIIASNLEDFLAEIDREDLDLDNLDKIDDSLLADHKQKILNFLRNFGSKWRKILQKNNIKSISTYQKDLINLRTGFIALKKSNQPIFIAGSTGSFKFTRNFIKSVSNLENGYIFLQGFDENISQNTLDSIQESHPLFIQKKLLNNLEVTIDKIKHLKYNDFKQSSDYLTKLSTNSFIASDKTKINNLTDDSIKNLTFIDSNNVFDEAKIISLIMLSELKNPDKNIALITSDETLCLIVSQILKKYNINIDNSKNISLEKSDFASYFVALAVFFEESFTSSNLLTILKNKITRVGFDNEFYLKCLSVLEIKILRKNFSLKNIDVISKKITEFGDKDLECWFFKIREALDIFAKCKSKNFLDLLQANFECINKLSKDSHKNHNIENLHGLSEFLEFIEDFQKNVPILEIEPEIYSKLLKQFLSLYKFETIGNFHPRLHILSPIEARILNFDVVIVSNLNQGEFLAQSSAQNWLSRSMKINFGLPDPKIMIGVGAFDFCNYLGNKKVYLTRSLTRNNTPCEKLSFLLKLESTLKANNLFYKIDRGEYWNFLLNELDARGSNPLISSKNEVSGLILDKAIKKISVTDIGKWIRSPYYIYAKRILELKPLNKLDEEASFLSFGNFVHEVLENYVKQYDLLFLKDESESLKYSFAKKVFKKYFLDEESEILWWPRFINMASWFIKNEAETRKDLEYSLAEVGLSVEISGVMVSTKVDRINFYKDGYFEIIDYKTGALPTNIDIKNGLEPQLAMESFIFLNKYSQKNKLKLDQKLTLESIKKLSYYSLKGRDQNIIKDLQNAEKLINSANYGIENLIKIFNEDKTPFYHAYDLDIYKINDYSHLARF